MSNSFKRGRPEGHGLKNSEYLIAPLGNVLTLLPFGSHVSRGGRLGGVNLVGGLSHCCGIGERGLSLPLGLWCLGCRRLRRRSGQGCRRRGDRRGGEGVCEGEANWHRGSWLSRGRRWDCRNHS